MKKRIFSLLVVLVMAVSVVIGVSLTSSAADGDGLKNSAISLAENVTLKMEVAIAEPTDGAYAKVTLPGGAVDATQLVANAPKNGSNYVFFAEVAVKDLAKDVTIEICNEDGSTLVAAATTSALAYCDAYTEGEFLGLVTALKAYANAADYYFDAAKTADSAAAADFAAIADVATAGTLPAGITHRSATLILESETTIRHYFELANGKYIDNYKFFVDLDKDGVCDVNEKLAPKAKTTEDGKTVYYVDVTDLSPNALDTVYTVGVTGVADDKTYTCDYGVLTYAKRAYANGNTEAKNLAAALLGYNTEAGKLKGDITFNANGGSAVAPQAYEYGVAFPVVAPTAKDGAIFLGWADATGKIVTVVPANATGDIALTAKWSEAKTVMTNAFDTYDNFVGINACANHKDTDSDGKCNACKVCIDPTNCTVYKDKTKCPTCEQTRKANGAVGPFGCSDSATVYGKSIAIADGNEAFLFANGFSGGPYWLIGTNKNGIYNCTYDADGNRIANSVTITMNLGKPTAQQIATVNDGVTVIGSEITDQYLPFTYRLYTKVTNGVYNNAGTTTWISDNVFSLRADGTLVCGGKTKKLSDGINELSLVMDVTETTADGIANDTFKWSLYLGGELVGSSSVALTCDISCLQMMFGQLRYSGNGYLLFDDMSVTTQPINTNVVNYNDGTTANYVPGTATKLPTPTKDGFKFAGWFADAALTQPIDEIPANAAGVFNVYPKWIQVGQYTEYNFAEDQMLIASLVYCDHVDEGADGKCDKCERCVAHTDANSDNICDVCGLKTARCGNAAANHTDANSDNICDVCGLSNKNAAGYQSSDKAIPGVTYDPSGEWSTGYAKGVAGENGGYLVVARVNGDGPAVSSNSANTISGLLADCDKKVMTYEIAVKKNGNEPVIGLDLRIRNSTARQFAAIRATSNGVTLGDEFVKLGYVIDFDAKEVRLYADGVYAGIYTSFDQFDYTTFNVATYGFLQMRLSGTGSICIDSIGIYAGDLYR